MMEALAYNLVVARERVRMADTDANRLVYRTCLAAWYRAHGHKVS